MKKHRSRAGLARGRVVDARLASVVVATKEDTCLVMGGMVVATKLVWVRTDHVHWRRFVRFCKRHGLVWKQPKKPVAREQRWTVDGVVDAPEVIRDKPYEWWGVLEVSGDVAGLRELIRMRLVKKWEDCLDVGEPRFHYRRR